MITTGKKQRLCDRSCRLRDAEDVLFADPVGFVQEITACRLAKATRCLTVRGPQKAEDGDGKRERTRGTRSMQKRTRR